MAELFEGVAKLSERVAVLSEGVAELSGRSCMHTTVWGSGGAAWPERLWAELHGRPVVTADPDIYVWGKQSPSPCSTTKFTALFTALFTRPTQCDSCLV